MANYERISRGYPGGSDRPGVITSKTDPRLAAVIAAERQDVLPNDARRGYPGILDTQPRPAFDGRVSIPRRSVGPVLRG